MKTETLHAPHGIDLAKVVTIQTKSENGYTRSQLERMLAGFKSDEARAEEALQMARQSIRHVELEMSTLPAKKRKA